MNEEIKDKIEDVKEDIAEQVDDAVKVAEEVNDSINEKVDDIKEDVAEKIDDVREAAEEVKDDITEKAEDIKEAVEEKIDDVKESVEEKVDDIKEAVQDKVETVKAQAADKKERVIKKKSGINTTTLITIIVCAVVVLACVAFVGIKLKWFYVPAKANFTVDDYSTIEVSMDDTGVTEDDVQNVLTAMQTHYQTTEAVTEGTTKDGDKIHITYVGKIKSTGEEFEVGSSGDAGTDLVLGSGTMIDGFEDGLIGKKVGSKVTLDLTFPEDYTAEELQGVETLFDVEIQSIQVTVTPEITDDFIKENSADFISYYFAVEDEQIDTLDNFRMWTKEHLYQNRLSSAIFDAMMEKTHVKTYDELLFDETKNYELTLLSYYGSMYGYDAEYMAKYYGAASADAYATEQAEYQLKAAMLFGKLADDLGIDHSDARLDEELTKYMEENGFNEEYTLEEFKETNGKAWVYQFQNYNMVSEEVIEALKANAKPVDKTPEETTVEDAEETTAA